MSDFRKGDRVRVVALPDDASDQERALIGKTGVLYGDYTGMASGTRYLSVEMDEPTNLPLGQNFIFFPGEIEKA